MAGYEFFFAPHSRLSFPLDREPPSYSFLSLLVRLRLGSGSGSSRLVLLEEPVHATIDALLQRPDRLVAQSTFGLVDVVVAGHAAHNDRLASECGCLSENVGENLTDIADGDADLTVETPIALCTLIIAGGTPDSTGKVPEVHRCVVCDEESLAVDTLVIKGDSGRGSGGE